MRAPRPCLGLLCLLACGSLVAAGCGGGGSSSGSQVNPEAESAESRPAPPKSAFPAPEGRSLEELIKNEAKSKAEIKVTTEALVFYPGSNRYPFSVARRNPATGEAGDEIPDAEVAVYFSRVPPMRTGKGSKGGSRAPKGSALEQPAVGPFPAQIESLATESAFQASSTTEAPHVASVVYSTGLDFPGPGEYRPIVLIKEKGGLEAKSLPSIHVGEFAKIPRPGERAPLIRTPTAKEAGGDLAALTTRVPPDTLNKVDYADVLGKEPIILLFASPGFCESRVCGPVVDVAQQAQHEFEGKANFIHMEIYNDNEPSQHVRPQVRKFHLPSEPWLFAIDREGVVRATIEGAFGTELMDKTVEKVVGG